MRRTGNIVRRMSLRIAGLSIASIVDFVAVEFRTSAQPSGSSHSANTCKRRGLINMSCQNPPCRIAVSQLPSALTAPAMPRMFHFARFQLPQTKLIPRTCLVVCRKAAIARLGHQIKANVSSNIKPFRAVSDIRGLRRPSRGWNEMVCL
jgi:hypothetical protein